MVTPCSSPAYHKALWGLRPFGYSLSLGLFSLPSSASLPKSQVMMGRHQLTKRTHGWLKNCYAGGASVASRLLTLPNTCCLGHVTAATATREETLEEQHSLPAGLSCHAGQREALAPMTEKRPPVLRREGWPVPAPTQSLSSFCYGFWVFFFYLLFWFFFKDLFFLFVKDMIFFFILKCS